MPVYFQKLLSDRNIPNHDGRSLWKYKLKENDYNWLRKQLAETDNLSKVAPRDCALYYALWWQFGYKGGTATKEDVFNSFKNEGVNRFTMQDFYRKAKVGAKHLGVQWIHHTTNNLYFRTMLLQGGVPINYCKQNGGIYYELLRNISNSNPNGVNDINPQYLCRLPKSLSENEDFLELCISLCNSPEDFKELVPDEKVLEELGKIKQARRNQVAQGRSGFSVNWFLDRNKQENQIYLLLEAPDTCTKEVMKSIIGQSELKSKYSLYVADELICEFIQYANGEYKRKSYQKRAISYQKDILIPFEMVSNGQSFDCSSFFLTNYPDFETPSLWAEVAESKYKLEKGNTTPNAKALVLFSSENTTAYNTFAYNEDLLCYEIFDGETKIRLDDKLYCFKTNHTTFKWEIIHQSPLWLKGSSMPIVNRNPIFKAYDDNDNISPTIEVKGINEFHWKSYSERRTVLPLGLVEFKLSYNGDSYKTTVFNVGSLRCEISSENIRNAEFRFSNLDFDIHFYPSDLYTTAVNRNCLSLNLNTTKIPSSVKFRIKHPRQRKSVIFYMDTCFSGVELTNNEEEVLEENQTLHLSNLKGYRLFTDKQNSYCIKFYNEDKPDLIRRIKISKSVISLHSFYSVFEHLFSLTSPIAKDNTICIDIEKVNKDNYSTVKTFKLKRFSNKINVKAINSWLSKNIIAIPINCPNEYIEATPIDTISTDQMRTYFSEMEDKGVDKFIVYEKTDEGFVCSQTEFFEPKMWNPLLDDETENTETSYDRVARYTEKLLQASPDAPIWQKILIQYQLCVNENLPFSTFEPLRALVSNPTLIAKCFFFLAVNNTAEHFNTTLWQKLEMEIGFSALWTPYTFWGDAINWILGFYGGYGVDFGIISSKYVEILSSETLFEVVNKLINEDNKENSNFHLNTEINKLRTNLGIRALEDLPINSKIKVDNKEIIPTNSSNFQVKPLLKSPVAIAESILNKTAVLWGYSIEKDDVRRLILYCEQIETEREDIELGNVIYSVSNWFKMATAYTIKKLEAN